MDRKRSRPDRLTGYFNTEWKALLLVTVSGLIYNVGLMAAPWFEGRLAGCLMDVLRGKASFQNMLELVIWYVCIIAAVQGFRYIKRFYVRRFANNVNRRMKKTLYRSLIGKSRAELEKEAVGSMLTKAISDVDDCAEGMHKFTTEIFDTGIALICYCGMLFYYDARLACICLVFPPISYFLAEKMKSSVQTANAEYKNQSGKLGSATLDKVRNAITYRIFGCDIYENENYERSLTAYEKSAVKINVRTSVLPPLYRIICMAGTVAALYFGSKNVLGHGWADWDIAAFTTFLSCYIKLSVKSSKGAKLFNSVQKAQVSWKRIKPFMKQEEESLPEYTAEPGKLEVRNLGFSYPSAEPVFKGISFEAVPGQIIGITGPVACGKSTLGKAFLCEYPYEGSIKFAGRELSEIPEYMRCGITGYLGHDSELLNDSIKNNILMGDDADAEKYLRAVCMDAEVRRMSSGIDTLIGSGGVRLSGGQAQRLALARTLCHKRPIYILDDPFSALDRETEKAVFSNLQKLAGNSIVLLISHRLYLFSQLDRVIWMDGGTAVCGTHDELVKKIPQYAELYKMQEKNAEKNTGKIKRESAEKGTEKDNDNNTDIDTDKSKHGNADKTRERSRIYEE